MHPSPSQGQIETEEAELDKVITVLEQDYSDTSNLLVEHLKGAKMYLLGGMPEEYGVELEMARKAAADLSQRDLRESASKAIDRLRSARTGLDKTTLGTQTPIRHRPRHEAPDVPQGRLWNFFGPAPVNMGMFYPTGFVAAVLPSFEAAGRALKSLRAAGFQEDDAIAVSGEEMSAFLKDLRARSGVWGQLMGALSRMIGTEQLFTDVDVDLARNGAGFLFVYSTDEASARLILETLNPFAPISVQRYMTGAVEGLVKPPRSPGPER
jgi:hypothetical protein